MARTATPKPATKESSLNEEVLKEDTAALNTLAVIESETSANVLAIATRLGYEGGLTVGALEDGIRFYQRRTVEAILETGTRLCILKELTPHGEFEKRVGLLGIGYDTANRFMKALQKTLKSRNLRLLSAEVKNASAFLELVTHDDGVIENLAEMDGFDRMSASQLREKAREIEGENVAIQKLLDKKNADFDKLSRRIAKTTPDQALLDLQKEATSLMNDALGCIRGQLRQACIALKDHGDGTVDHSRFMAGLLGQVQADLTALRVEFDLPDVSNARDQALLAEQAQWANS